MKAGLDRTDLQTGNIGDFLIRKTLKKGKNYHQPEIFGQVIDGLADVIIKDLGEKLLFRVGNGLGFGQLTE